MNLFANLLLNILFQSGWATAQKAFIKAELGEIVNNLLRRTCKRLASA